MAIRVSVLLLSMSLPDAALRSICSSGNHDGAVDGGDAPVAGTQLDLLATGVCGHGAASTSLIPTSTNESLWVADATPRKNLIYPLGGYTVSSYGLTSMAANGFTTGMAAPMSTIPATGDCTAVPDSSGNVWVANTDGKFTAVP